MKDLTRQLVKYKHRNLPHWTRGEANYFVTFRALIHLPNEARRIVVEEIASRTDVMTFGAVVMPDHVHWIFHPRQLESGTWPCLGNVMRAVKGRSSRKVNLLLGRQGSLWQKESFDRIIRDEQEFWDTYIYVMANPVRAGLCTDREDYPFQHVDLSWL